MVLNFPVFPQLFASGGLRERKSAIYVDFKDASLSVHELSLCSWAFLCVHGMRVFMGFPLFRGLPVCVWAFLCVCGLPVCSWAFLCACGLPVC